MEATNTHTTILLLIMLALLIPHLGSAYYWMTYWSRFTKEGVHQSSTTMKKKRDWMAAVACLRLVASAVVLAVFLLHPQLSANWLGWLFAALCTLHALHETIKSLYILRSARATFQRGLQHNNPDLVRLGIEGGADIEMPLGEDGEFTPLTFSAISGNFEACRMLLEAGADPNRRSLQGYHALCEAVRNPKVALENRTETVRLLLEHGAKFSVHFGDRNETTTLLHAAMKGYSDVCRLLLEAGADPNQRNGRGHLALTEMIGNPKLTVEKRIEIAALLLKHGADARQLDWGRPALHYAVQSARLVSLLLEYGADINQPSEYHELSAPRPRQKFEYQENALRWFFKMIVPAPLPNRHDIIKTLLEAGADPLQPNSEGYTAWDFVNNLITKGLILQPPTGISDMADQAMRADFETYTKAVRADFEAYAKCLKPIVLEARFDVFLSYAEGSGWGEFYRGRLENTGKRIWYSDLLKRNLPHYEDVMRAHIAQAPAAVVFLSPDHFFADTCMTKERAREFHSLLERFSPMSDKLLLVSTSETVFHLVNQHPVLKPFDLFQLDERNVNDLWRRINQLSSLPLSCQQNVFFDLLNMQEQTYDCFISYRSASVHTVRFLAEQLVARGVKTWFAEWEILVSGRRGFQEPINRGLAASKTVLCCTNTGYAASEYCRIEAMQVLDVPGKEYRNILELRMPAESNAISTALQQKGSGAVIVKDQSLDETWYKYCKFLGIQNETLPKRETGGNTVRISVAESYFYMNINERWSVNEINTRMEYGNIISTSFTRKIGNVSLECVLIIGSHLQFDIGWTEKFDNRAMFESIIASIPRWTTDSEKIIYPRGVHVIHVPALQLSSQLIAHTAITYLDSDRDDYFDAYDVPIEKCVWHRKYIILVPPPYMPSAMEFCFDFDMRGVAHDDFATFCRYAYMMDDLVRGLGFS